MTLYYVGLLVDLFDNARYAGDDADRAAWEAAERSDQRPGEVWAVWRVDDPIHPVCIAYQAEVYPHVSQD